MCQVVTLRPGPPNDQQETETAGREQETAGDIVVHDKKTVKTTSHEMMKEKEHRNRCPFLE